VCLHATGWLLPKILRQLGGLISKGLNVQLHGVLGPLKLKLSCWLETWYSNHPATWCNTSVEWRPQVHHCKKPSILNRPNLLREASIKTYMCLQTSTSREWGLLVLVGPKDEVHLLLQSLLKTKAEIPPMKCSFFGGILSKISVMNVIYKQDFYGQ